MSTQQPNASAASALQVAPAYASIAVNATGELAFQNLGQVMAFAALCEKAQFLPKGMTKEGAVLSLVAGLQLGLPPFSAMQNIAVINGRPSVWGDAVGGLVKASGLLVDEYVVESNENNNYKVEFHVLRKGKKHETVKSFSFADAIRAGLMANPKTGSQPKPGPWTQYPKVMVERRARAFAYREEFPDVLKGIRIIEEEQDAPLDVTDTGTASAPPYAGAAPRKLPAGAIAQLPGAAPASDPDNPAALFGKEKQPVPADGNPSEGSPRAAPATEQPGETA